MPFIANERDGSCQVRVVDPIKNPSIDEQGVPARCSVLLLILCDISDDSHGSVLASPRAYTEHGLQGVWAAELVATSRP